MGLGIGSAVAGGDILTGLTAKEREGVMAGEQLLVTKAVSGYPWPQAQIYQRTPLKPEELMAVFFDYNAAHRFVPNCRISRVSRQISPLRCEVDYEVSVPVLPDEKYTAENTLSHRSGGGYVVSWKLLRATNIESSEGSFAVASDGEGGSIIRYTSLIKPASRAAILLRGVAMGQMRDTVHAIVREAKMLRADHPAQLDAKVRIMNQALTSG